MSRRRRLDLELVRRGLAPSRQQAQELVVDGLVTVAGAIASKPSTLVSADTPLGLIEPPRRWASRGGDKLDGALERFSVVVAGRHALDAGASSGGFTDVLLDRGAVRVVAVDVGYGQLDWRLRQDPRVVVLDRTNVRHLRPADVPPPPADLVVADLSFISLTLVLPALGEVAAADADFVLLVKPQFEAGPQRLGKGGVVRDPQVWSDALERVATAAAKLPLGVVDAVRSVLPGASGNVEFFLHLRRDEDGDGTDVLTQAVDEAHDWLGLRR